MPDGFSSIYAKDAAKWLRDRWPHRPMTTGGLPDENFQPPFHPTREDIERWLVEYASDSEALHWWKSRAELAELKLDKERAAISANDKQGAIGTEKL